MTEDRKWILSLLVITSFVHALFVPLLVGCLVGWFVRSCFRFSSRRSVVGSTRLCEMDMGIKCGRDVVF